MFHIYRHFLVQDIKILFCKKSNFFGYDFIEFFKICNYFLIHLSVQSLVQEFSPIFGSIKEFQQIQTIVELIAQVNSLLDKTNRIFTVQSFFGDSLTEFFMRKLKYEKILISTSQFLSSGLDFQRVKLIQLLF